MKATICPVCKGEGQICVGINPFGTSATPITKPCHGCKGLGWVVIPSYVVVIPKQKPQYPPMSVSWIWGKLGTGF